MIKLIYSLPEITSANVEYLKIKCLFDSYGEDNSVCFWVQTQSDTYISLSDGNMIIKSDGCDVSELCEFVNVMRPKTVFSDLETLKISGIKIAEEINVMVRKADIKSPIQSDSFSSKEIYGLLNIPDFPLPDYPHFAVDFCRRLNRNFAQYFGIKEKSVAVSFNSGNFALINGIVSRQKGFGELTLKGIMSKNYGREILVCCKNELTGFYEKFGFRKIYKAGIGVTNEHK